jgi:hypothetical protein
MRQRLAQHYEAFVEQFEPQREDHDEGEGAHQSHPTPIQLSRKLSPMPASREPMQGDIVDHVPTKPRGG